MSITRQNKKNVIYAYFLSHKVFDTDKIDKI